MRADCAWKAAARAAESLMREGEGLGEGKEAVSEWVEGSKRRVEVLADWGK